MSVTQLYRIDYNKGVYDAPPSLGSLYWLCELLRVLLFLAADLFMSLYNPVQIQTGTVRYLCMKFCLEWCLAHWCCRLKEECLSYLSYITAQWRSSPANQWGLEDYEQYLTLVAFGVVSSPLLCGNLLKFYPNILEQHIPLEAFKGFLKSDKRPVNCLLIHVVTRKKYEPDI